MGSQSFNLNSKTTFDFLFDLISSKTRNVEKTAVTVMKKFLNKAILELDVRYDKI